MLDDDAWECIGGILSAIDQHRRPPPGARPADVFGAMHLILFGHSCTLARMSHHHFAHPPRFILAPPPRPGDFKQLPPATSKPPFIVQKDVCTDFAFRVLRQNRRVCSGAGTEDRQEELENFHQVGR